MLISLPPFPSHAWERMPCQSHPFNLHLFLLKEVWWERSNSFFLLPFFGPLELSLLSFRDLPFCGSLYYLVEKAILGSFILFLFRTYFGRAVRYFSGIVWFYFFLFFCLSSLLFISRVFYNYRDNLFSRGYTLVQVLTSCIYYTCYLIYMTTLLFHCLHGILTVTIFWIKTVLVYIFTAIYLFVLFMVI